MGRGSGQRHDSSGGTGIAARNPHATKVRRQKTLVRGAGVIRAPATSGAETAPRSFREGVERLLVNRAKDLFQRSLKRMSTEQIERAIAAPTPAGTIVEVLNAAPEVGLARETATIRAG